MGSKDSSTGDDGGDATLSVSASNPNPRRTASDGSRWGKVQTRVLPSSSAAGPPLPASTVLVAVDMSTDAMSSVAGGLCSPAMGHRSVAGGSGSAADEHGSIQCRPGSAVVGTSSAASGPGSAAVGPSFALVGPDSVGMQGEQLPHPERR